MPPNLWTFHEDVGADSGGGDVDVGWAMVAEGTTVRRVATKIGAGAFDGILLEETTEERVADVLTCMGWAKACTVVCNSSL